MTEIEEVGVRKRRSRQEIKRLVREFETSGLSHEELSLLLGGIDLTRTRSKDWYRKTIPDSEKA
jgi:hypothetical protein